jgi:hypothetical protein
VLANCTLIVAAHDEVEISVLPRHPAEVEVERPATAHPPRPRVPAHQLGRVTRLELPPAGHAEAPE